MAKSYTTLSVNVLRISESGKAVEVLDATRPADEQELWIPISLLDDDSAGLLGDYIESMGPSDLHVETWFLKKEGWA